MEFGTDSRLEYSGAVRLAIARLRWLGASTTCILDCNDNSKSQHWPCIDFFLPSCP
jgi:hypothetical protein